jgi:hypothetical protein
VFAGELSKSSSRSISVGSNDANRERAELGTAFPQRVIKFSRKLNRRGKRQIALEGRGNNSRLKSRGSEVATKRTQLLSEG